jgi:hypothetical protein
MGRFVTVSKRHSELFASYFGRARIHSSSDHRAESRCMRTLLPLQEGSSISCRDRGWLGIDQNSVNYPFGV